MQRSSTSPELFADVLRAGLIEDAIAVRPHSAVRPMGDVVSALRRRTMSRVVSLLLAANLLALTAGSGGASTSVAAPRQVDLVLEHALRQRDRADQIELLRGIDRLSSAAPSEPEAYLDPRYQRGNGTVHRG